MTSPIGNALLRAGACFGMPAFFARRLVCSLPKYCNSSEPVEDETLLDHLKDLSQEFGMKGKVDLFERKEAGDSYSEGSAALRVFRKAIYLETAVGRIDTDAAHWLMRREFCVLKNNPDLLSAGALLAYSFVNYALPLSLAASAIAAVASYYIPAKINTRTQEIATRQAFEGADEEELQGALRYFLGRKRARERWSGQSNEYDKSIESIEYQLRTRFDYSPQDINKVGLDLRIGRLKDHYYTQLKEEFERNLPDCPE
jgi:hypothetical protein